MSKKLSRYEQGYREGFEAALVQAGMQISNMHRAFIADQEGGEQPPADTSAFHVRVDNLGLSSRALGRLEVAQLGTVRDVVIFDRKHGLTSIGNLGMTVFAEISTKLALLGIDLYDNSLVIPPK